MPLSALAPVQGVVERTIRAQRTLVRDLKKAMQQSQDATKPAAAAPRGKQQRAPPGSGRRKKRARIGGAAQRVLPRFDDDGEGDAGSGEGEGNEGAVNGGAGDGREAVKISNKNAQSLMLPRWLQRLEELELMCLEMHRTHHVPTPRAADTEAAFAWASGTSLSASAELSRIGRGGRVADADPNHASSSAPNGDGSGPEYDDEEDVEGEEEDESGEEAEWGGDEPPDGYFSGSELDCYDSSSSDDLHQSGRSDDDENGGGWEARFAAHDDEEDVVEEEEDAAPTLVVSFQKGKKRIVPTVV